MLKLEFNSTLLEFQAISEIWLWKKLLPLFSFPVNFLHQDAKSQCCIQIKETMRRFVSIDLTLALAQVHLVNGKEH